MYKPTPLLSYFWGLFSGLIISAFLFNSLTQDEVASEQIPVEAQQNTPSASSTSDAPAQSLASRAELLLKYYTIRDGAEETNLAPLLQKNGHLEIFRQMLQQSTADVSDLIQSTHSFTAAQFYASLVRIKQKDEEQQAKAQLELLKPAPVLPAVSNP
ncbi:MAG: hypothetical protein KJ556_07990 [Gammaproteobacteria bacterium]|nr:hypothetical protein [Gammaproteobacteria bacterium]MBU2058961.1 hypothetical protein [Gammaproteobacteria bacterium]MBU2175050.1 hypothetical protein [Gammaproteobacteria bacterium]MBU2246733.1 hypothetical protein [Gammaproteobacteria bacterium]MBU2345919.1 hypothetical protein [Gammaproteobacteria bacterium]